MRRIVHAHAPDVFARLDFDDDDVFVEPMAFVLASRGEPAPSELAVVYAGAMPADRRSDLDVQSDDEGRVFLPGLGYLSELPPRKPTRLVVSGSAPLGYVPLGCRSVATALSEWGLGESQPSLLPYAIAELAVGVAPGGVLSHQERAARVHRETLVNALALLESVWPRLAATLKKLVRHIVLFRAADQNSFASLSAHGIVFLNVQLGQTESFFVEDVVHQGGHVQFTAAWEGSEPLLTVEPQTRVEQLVGREDHRTLEVALHGMFTQALMVGALDRLSRSDADIDTDEATGRLLFALFRLGLDLREFAALDVYSAAGTALLRDLIATYTETATRYRDLLGSADFQDQPYNFDYETYRKRNATAHAEVRS